MPRKRKISNLKDRCRICLLDHGCMSNLFEERLETKIKDLTKCTSIDIKDEEGFPNVICHLCLYKLDMWSEFKEQFIESNCMLLGKLEYSEVTDDAVSQTKKVCPGSQQSGEDSISDSPDKKKSKTEVPPLIPLEFASVDCVADQRTLKEMYISEDEPASSKDSLQKVQDGSGAEKHRSDEEHDNKESVPVKPSLVPMKVKSLTGRRGRTTERRKASTKRWVARKKALIAATGEEVSDTDSIGSEETQLSPAQKARAKNNADKEAERQKIMAKAIKNLEKYMTGTYAIKHDSDSFLGVDTDSDTRRTRSKKDVNSDVSQTGSKSPASKDCVKNDETKKDKLLTNENSKEKESSPATATEKPIAEDTTKKTDNQTIDDTFTPHSVKSELEVGDATYIVTSTLILAEPHYLNKANLNNLSKEYKNGTIEQNLQEKNTDIIDAVQLRRIHPVSANTNEKKCIERCLNIEVEGTELEALKRVQVELAGFVEKEMKHRLFGTHSETTKKEKTGNVYRSSYQTLDQQLKTIVEKAIKKNFETSMMRACGTTPKLGEQKSRTVSPSFVSAAMNSKKYQPKVVVKRLDVAKESKHQKINNIHAASQRTVKGRLGGPFSMVARKRQSVPPIKYNDYNTSTMDSESNLSDEVIIPKARPAASRNNEAKKPQVVVPEQIMDTMKQIENSVSSTVDANSMILSVPRNKNSTLSYDKKMEVSENSSSLGEKHICGVCEQSFGSRNEVAAHFRTHKVDGAAPRPNKHKMMRCKRCHEIVEARFVKAHVCKSTKQVHKCYVCNSTFRTEKLLVRHLESHDQSEFNIEHITKSDTNKSNSLNVSQSGKQILLSKSDKDQLLRTEITENARTGISNGQSEKIILAKGTKLEAAKAVEKPKETYTCFVCDKIFTDEEVLKDHLQKHCDDVSEDEQSTGKEQYQCAICGDSLESEDALEAHVEKHLFDDEDDNPNLISITSENEKSKEDSYSCLQCAETFNSEMLLEMHMQAHEEEAAIAEWEKQGIRAYEYQCMICDELFETEEELSEHLDVHNGNAHVCQLCEKPFPTLEDLQKHVATH